MTCVVLIVCVCQAPADTLLIEVALSLGAATTYKRPQRYRDNPNALVSRCHTHQICFTAEKPPLHILVTYRGGFNILGAYG